DAGWDDGDVGDGRQQRLRRQGGVDGARHGRHDRRPVRAGIGRAQDGRRASRGRELRRATMRFMGLVKADKKTEAGVLPDIALVEAMGKFNEELVKAGVMQAGDGLHPSSKGVRIQFSGTKRTVVDGPFAETKELVAGFWLWQCASLEDAIA